MNYDKIYELSVAKAILLGYEPVDDPQAYRGKCYQKKIGNKIVKWILFHPQLLLIKLNLTEESQLVKLGYNIDDFDNHHPVQVDMRNDDYLADLAQLEYEDERKEHISYLLANAGVDPDEVDDDDLPELIRQIGP